MARRVSCPTLIGRSAQLGRLDAALTEARDGSSVLLFVAGDAGIGKSRLVETFAGRARERDALVFTGRCLDLAEGTSPYAPFVAALRPLADELTTDELGHVLGEAPRELGALLPGLCGRPPAQQNGIERGRLYELALGLFQRMAALRPAVLILEDLHWIDPASADLLNVIGGNLRMGGLVVIGTYRSDEVPRDHPLHRAVIELVRSGRAERVELSGLSRDQVAAQVEGIVGTTPAARQISSLFDRTEGNPFFVEELVAAGPATRELPASLREVLLTRVERLGAPTRGVLRAVATIGRVCDESLIAEVTGLSPIELDDGLHEAVTHRLLIVSGEGYDLRHALLREALHAELLPGERGRLHRAVAEALERRDEPAELARHWYAAGDRGRALAAFVAAGTAAQETYAWAVAHAHYERALKLWQQVAGAESRCGLNHVDLLKRAAEAAMAEGDFERAIELTEEAMGEGPTWCLYTLRGRIHWMAGDMTDACAAYDEAIALLPDEDSCSARAQVRSLQAHALMLQGRFSESLAYCREAVQIAVEVGARALEGYARNTMGVDLSMLGETAAGLAELAKALRIAKERDDYWELGRTYVNYSDGLISAGDWKHAAEIGMEGVHVCRRLGYGRTTGMCAAGNTLNALIRLGRWADADRLADDVRDLDAPPWQRWIVTLALADLELRRGRPDGARRQLASLAETAASSDDIDLTSAYHACRAHLAIADGDHRSALERARRGLDFIRGSEFTRRGPELCATGLRAGAKLGEDPAELLAECRELLAGLPSMPEPEAYGRQAEAEAAVDDPEAWRAAASAWGSLGESYNVAYCRFRQAGATLAARGSRREAGEALHEAREMAAELGAAGLRREIDGLAQRARLHKAEEPSPGTNVAQLAEPKAIGGRPIGAAGLTPRESEVLALLSSGRTNRQIAEALFISERTVGVHVSRILRKLGVPNRGAAAHLFRASG